MSDRIEVLCDQWKSVTELADAVAEEILVELGIRQRPQLRVIPGTATRRTRRRGQLRLITGAP